MAYWSRDFMEDWIPVEERVPMRGQRVIVACYNPENFMDTHVSICDYYGPHPGGPTWSGRKCVSHWMPLPKVPEGYERKDGKRGQCYWR